MDTSGKIGMNTIVEKRPGLIATDMDGEKVMLNIETGKYFGLDAVGSSIWELLENRRSLREIVEQLQQEYEVDEQTCLNDVASFLDTLHSRGLIQID